MTIAEFIRLSDTDKATALERGGVIVGRTSLEGFDYLLYQLDSFYVEGKFDSDGLLLQIISFDTTAPLDKYLPDIDLPDLEG